jgi:hypothetical protein
MAFEVALFEDRDSLMAKETLYEWWFAAMARATSDKVSRRPCRVELAVFCINFAGLGFAGCYREHLKRSAVASQTEKLDDMISAMGKPGFYSRRRA